MTLPDPKPIRAILRLKNNAIIERRERMGYTGHGGCRRFCTALGLSYSSVIALETMYVKPFKADGGMTKTAAGLAEALGVLPEDLWPAEVLAIKQRLSIRTLDLPEMLALGGNDPALLQPGPDAQLGREEMITLALENLHDRDRNILIWRYMDELSLDEIGDQLWLSRERVRQLISRAIEKVKKGPNGKLLKGLWREDDGW